MSPHPKHRSARPTVAPKPSRRGMIYLTLAVVAAALLLFVGCEVHTPTAAGPAVTLVVTPNATLPISGTQQFTAVAEDVDGRAIAITPSWTVVAGGGTISNTGMFTAGTMPGTYTGTVQAAAAGLTATANVTVTVGNVLTIAVTPNPRTVAQGGTQQFVAVGRDAANNVVAITPVWSVTASGGTINATSGLFTAGGVNGSFVNTVRATSGTVFGTATVNVATTVPASPFPLGAAATHGVLAGSNFSCVSLGIINADASVWPGSAISGFPPCTITGARHNADAFAQTAQGDLTIAYNQLMGLPCGTTLVADLGGQTLQPGVYCSLTSQGLTGEVFLDALGDPNATFVIRAASTITTANASVTLLNGAEARNVFWVAGSSATLGVGSAMKGNIIALTSITLIDNASILGRALARNGAVTLNNNNVITLP